LASNPVKNTQELAYNQLKLFMLNLSYSIGIWKFVGIYSIYGLVSIYLFYLTALPGLGALIILGVTAVYYIAMGFVMLTTAFVRSRRSRTWNIRISFSLVLLLVILVLQVIILLCNFNSSLPSMGYYASCIPSQNFIQRVIAPLPEGSDCSTPPWISGSWLFILYLLYSITGGVFWLRAILSSRK